MSGAGLTKEQVELLLNGDGDETVDTADHKQHWLQHYAIAEDGQHWDRH
jgi:hypothetical protein